MPILPEEEADSPGESSTSSSPSTYSPVESRALNMALHPPAIVFPKQAVAGEQDPRPLKQPKPHSPRVRLSRNLSPSSGGSITTVDSAGHVIDLLNTQLPDLQLSEKDRRRNLELLEEAKRASDHFLSRRGRRSTCSPSQHPTAGLSPNHTPRSSPVPSRSSSLTLPTQIAGEAMEVNYVSPLVSQRTDPGDSSSQDQEESPRTLDWKISEKRKVSSGTLSPRYASLGPPREKTKLWSETERGREADKVEERCLGVSSLRKGPDGDAPAMGVAKPVPRLPAQQWQSPPAHQGSHPPAQQGLKPLAHQGLNPPAHQGSHPPAQQGLKPLAHQGLNPPAHQGSHPPAQQGLKPLAHQGLNPPAHQGPRTAEVRTLAAFPPVMQAMAWDTHGSCQKPGKLLPSSKPAKVLSTFNKPDESLQKSPGLGDFAEQPAKWQKLAKLREEHKLIRNQNVMASKLPDLSETAEQERGTPSEANTKKEKLDVMAHISDVTLRKMKLHRAQPGCAPLLTEKEVENAFVQLSLAFRNDNYTLETRLRQAERERNLTEENTEKELEEFKGSLKGSTALWQNPGQRESHQRLLETAKVLHQLAVRLSCRAEMVGAVRQEKRMNKATEVMMNYVENLKRTYEKDHAELMEFKKLANQNSSRCFRGSIDNGDDGVPRSSRSMSLTLGKPLPRRRVSVAVVPKFNLLNVPSPTTSPLLPALCEANIMKCSSPTEPAQQALIGGKVRASQEGGTVDPAKPLSKPDDIEAQIKARIEEDAYNKGYLEGLRRSKELQKLEEKEEENLEEKEEKKDTGKKCNRKYGYPLDGLDQLGPKLFRWNRLVCVAMALFAVTFFVVSFFTYFGDPYGTPDSAPAGKTACPGKKKVSGSNVRYHPTNPRPE